MKTVPPATDHAPDTFQHAVITSEASSIRVLAPAGSGKTETLARRAGHQIRSGIFPHRILILTFDTQARASFQRALQRLDIPGRSTMTKDELVQALQTANDKATAEARGS